jgi:hypothetical protein
LDNTANFNPSSVQYSYTDNEGTIIDNDGQWTDWQAVDGVYLDMELENEAESPCTHQTAYAFVDDIPFDKLSLYENKVRFRVYYKDDYVYSPVYVVRTNNTYYVATSGSDSTGNGTSDNPWATVSHAINNVVATPQSNAVIQVRKGTYIENIVLRDYIHIHGDYNGGETIIQGDGTSHVVTMDANTKLDGITIVNGNSEYGGGIYCLDNNVTIENCTIKNCNARYGGGASFIGCENIIIRNCLFKNNTAQVGGGLFNKMGTIKFSYCDFVDNSVTVHWPEDYPYNGEPFGGAIHSIGASEDDNYSLLEIDNCFFKNNTTTVAGGAISLYGDSRLILKSSVFLRNISGIEGGAVSQVFHAYTQVDILGCYFIYNQAVLGSAINSVASNTHITNCTFFKNITNDNIWSNGSAIISGTTNQLINCIFWGNTSNYGDPNFSGTKSLVTYSCIDDTSYTGTGVIHDNPLFVEDYDNDNLNLRLTKDSPCIDMGNDNATGLDELLKDPDGNPRLFKFYENRPAHVDMGADEYFMNFKMFTRDNDGIAIEWYSVENEEYYIEYTDSAFTYTASPVLHYSLNDNDNDSVVTESISSINAALYNQQGSINTENCSATGKLNTTFTFSGQEYINCGNTGNFTSDLSLAAWVYKDSTASNAMNIVAKDWNNSYRIRVNSDGKVWVYLNNTQPSYTSTSSLIASDTWVHLVVTISFATGDQNIRIYVDGELEETIAHTKTSITSTSGNLIIGAFGAGSTSESWKGYLDDIRLYDIVLSQTDVDSLYYGGIGTEERNPLPWTRVAQSITGQQGSTSWTDDGTETSPAPDDSSVDHRFYRVVFDN